MEAVTPEAEIIEAAGALANLLEASPSKHQSARDSAIRRPMRKIKKLARGRFRTQRKAVLDSHALASLKTILDRTRVSESDDPKRNNLEADIAAELSTHVYMVPVSAADGAVFDGSIAAAVNAGASAAADMTDTAVARTESFIAEYLKDAGFSRLTGEIDKTTVDNLASAIADAYESGGDFETVVRAVEDSFSQASDYRARMIAQTELNDAWNQSVLHFGEQAGATKKEWVTDIAPCPICIENTIAGEIELDGEFASGDDAPPAHPNCMCSIMVHA